MIPLRIHTRRVDLIEVTPQLAQANLDDLAELARLLKAKVASTWPAEHWDADAIRWLIDRARQQPEDRGWFAWYVVLRPHANGQTPSIGSESSATLIGTCGMKGPPDPAGAVEVGYGIVAEHRRQGFALEATRGLIEWALRDARVKSIAAETFPDHAASLGVMRRLGMRHVGDGSDPGAVRYAATRATVDVRAA